MEAAIRPISVATIPERVNKFAAVYPEVIRTNEDISNLTAEVASLEQKAQSSQGLLNTMKAELDEIDGLVQKTCPHLLGDVPIVEVHSLSSERTIGKLARKMRKLLGLVLALDPSAVVDNDVFRPASELIDKNVPEISNLNSVLKVLDANPRLRCCKSKWNRREVHIGDWMIVKKWLVRTRPKRDLSDLTAGDVDQLLKEKQEREQRMADIRRENLQKMRDSTS
jgi:hypothetical protein